VSKSREGLERFAIRTLEEKENFLLLFRACFADLGWPELNGATSISEYRISPSLPSDRSW